MIEFKWLMISIKDKLLGRNQVWILTEAQEGTNFFLAKLLHEIKAVIEDNFLPDFTYSFFNSIIYCLNSFT
jgi:hypothetical protein